MKPPTEVKKLLPALAGHNLLALCSRFCSSHPEPHLRTGMFGVGLGPMHGTHTPSQAMFFGTAVA